MNYILPRHTSPIKRLCGMMHQRDCGGTPFQTVQPELIDASSKVLFRGFSTLASSLREINKWN